MYVHISDLKLVAGRGYTVQQVTLPYRVEKDLPIS